MKRLYFDHNASTPADPRVIERFVHTERAVPANPGSLHTAGRAARGVLESAREQIAAQFEVDAERVVFVSGGTEANNLAVRTLGDPVLPVLCAALEHPSVFEPSAARGWVELAVDASGYARWDLPGAGIGLVCAVHGQNEVGTLQDLQAARAIASELAVPLHVDAAQTVGRVPLDELIALADTIAVSGHKLGGMRGCGALIGRSVAKLGPLFLGGGQEFGLRPGTPSPALADSLAYAIALAVEERPVRAAAMRRARDAFEHTVLACVDRARVLTPPTRSLPNTSMMMFEDLDGRSLLPALDIAGVEASAGSACSSGSPRPPRVLLAMGLSERDARCCVRFTFAHSTTVDDACEGARRVVDIVARLQRA